MKKLLLLSLLATMMVGCDYVKSSYTTPEGIRVSIIDSCEYLHYAHGHGPHYTHKGNCKFCLERNKKMIKEQIDTVLIEIFD